MKRCLIMACLLIIFSITPAGAATATFDNLALASESHYGGAGSGIITGFTNGDAYFPHTSAAYSWSGFTYSNHTDTTTAGYTNQFSAITGGGVKESANYGISFVPLDWQSGSYDPIPQTISFGAVTTEDYNTTISGMYVTNTTYAYLSMFSGNGFAKKFGGTTGDDADWFKLTYKGIKTDASYTAAHDFYLADFRFADNAQDYILKDWTWLDFTNLGNIVGIEFSLSSSDNSTYGMNTPGYFAMDDLNGSSPVPIPTAIWLLGSGLIGLFGLKRKILK